jgi:hypothetical protein
VSHLILTQRGCPDKNLHGFYPFHRPDLDGGLRDLRDPDTTDEEE